MTPSSGPTRLCLFAVAFVTAAVGLAFGPCGTGVSGQPTPVVRQLAAGETLGKVDRTSSGTPDTSVRTVLSVTCKNGRLTIRTNVDAITAADDCAPPIPQSTLDQLLGMPAVVTYTGDHLVIENTVRGVKLELPATNATVGAIHGAP